MQTIRVGKVEDFDDPGKLVVTVGEEEYGVFCVGGDFYAWKNECPHQGGPVCQGRIFKRVVELIDAKQVSHGRDYADDGRVNIVCPWHGMEFDIRTGEFPGNKDMAMQAADVQVQGDEVFLII